MVRKILIIGKGSVSLKHKHAIKLISKKFKITNLSSREFSNGVSIKNNFDFIILCSPSSFHYDHYKIIEKKFKNTKVLIEKPLFNKPYKIKKKPKNLYFVGYNLRFHPVIKFLKKYLKEKQVFFVRANCSSYLPSWRKKNYHKAVSAKKKFGGGVLLELSHEIDYLLWIFKKIKINYSLNKKVSKLQINTDDIFILNCITPKKTIINLTINFFSRIPNREIYIDGKNFSIYANILNNSITLIEQKKTRIIKFKNFSMNETFKLENLSILNNDLKDICTFKEGNELINLISKIKKNEN